MVANRIDPLGQFTTLPQRGGFMGNRGRLHDLNGQIRRSWQTKAWITCTLRDKPGRASPGVTPPNSYTRLFFLDESVACAAGHRPCAECRRAQYRLFRQAWHCAHGPTGSVKEIDAALHTARRQGPYQAPAATLPDGVFILHADQPARLSGDSLYPYAHGTYSPKLRRPMGTVTVLTPSPLVATFRAGFLPVLTPKADSPNW